MTGLFLHLNSGFTFFTIHSRNLQESSSRSRRWRLIGWEMAVIIPAVITAVRFEATDSNGATPRPPPPPRNPTFLPHLSLTKPSWVVRTKNVRIEEERKKPDPSCVVCEGSGRVDCQDCDGIGRTNSVHLAMLPKGEWPKWCRTCGGSGLGFCCRCLGTGEYRYIMGFQFMKIDQNESQHHRIEDNRKRRTVQDLLFNDENEQ